MKDLALKIGDDVLSAPKGIPTGGMTSGGGKVWFFNSTGENIIQAGLSLLVLIGILLALAFLILGGFQWIMSGGDKEQIQKARNKLIFSIIGLILIIMSVFIVTLIGNIFGIALFRIPGVFDESY